GSLYAGIATDVQRRVSEHNAGKRGSRYTRSRRPVQLLTCWPFEDRGTATRAEIALKRLDRSRKLQVIEGRRSVPWEDR
ncbi:MAG: GIY-YIG nuclease family protein, partial [Myxococcota bacterium]|nr:GIY-YIG nuclease family protein [Myxococcota bacterium]